MQFLGKYQLGDEINVEVQAKTSAGVPTEPAAAPIAYVVDLSDGSAVENFSLPIILRGRETAKFQENRLLGSAYSSGGWFGVSVEFTVGGNAKAEAFTFEVVAGGGDADGHLIGLHYLERPEADNVQYVTRSGKLVNSRNPY